MVLSAFALFGGALAVVDNYWQADADGNWNGSWADPAHWKTKGGITAGQRGRFDLKSNQPIEVTIRRATIRIRASSCCAAGTPAGTSR